MSKMIFKVYDTKKKIRKLKSELVKVLEKVLEQLEKGLAKQ